MFTSFSDRVVRFLCLVVFYGAGVSCGNSCYVRGATVPKSVTYTEPRCYPPRQSWHVHCLQPTAAAAAADLEAGANRNRRNPCLINHQWWWRSCHDGCAPAPSPASSRLPPRLLVGKLQWLSLVLGNRYGIFIDKKFQPITLLMYVCIFFFCTIHFNLIWNLLFKWKHIAGWAWQHVSFFFKF